MAFGAAFLAAFAWGAAVRISGEQRGPEDHDEALTLNHRASPTEKWRQAQAVADEASFIIPGVSYQQIVLRLLSDEGGKLDLWEYHLSPADLMRKLDGLLDEAARQMDGDRARALAWLAGMVVADEDLISLSALAGEALRDEEVLRRVDSLLLGREGPACSLFRKEVLSRFAVHDPEAGFRWIAEVDEAGAVWEPRGALELESYLSGEVVRALMVLGPEAALAEVQALQYPTDRQAAMLLDACETAVAAQDWECLWKSVSAPGVSEDRRSDAVTALARANPMEAAERLDLLELRGVFRESAEQRILTSWITASPQQAFEWIYGNRSRWVSSAPLTRIFERWVNADSLKAETALAGIPQGSDRDDAITGMVRSAAGLDPEVVMKWVGSMSDPEKRKAAESILNP